ncbi:MAG: 9-O-acetyl-N-acetylneuraminate esterase, partial [Alphaproteobacteria bacterium]|nr:9-O-acetyl-N-acetylneuraminate esterase [Alphaproteobacteria bacterium]
LFRVFKRWCKASETPIILIIDEVDSATNNQVFLDFLAQLRDGYIARTAKGTATFHSVILAGVTDIKNLKRKIRPEDAHKFNSPWNIASDFNIDMSLSAQSR